MKKWIVTQRFSFPDFSWMTISWYLKSFLCELLGKSKQNKTKLVKFYHVFLLKQDEGLFEIFFKK